MKGSKDDKKAPPPAGFSMPGVDVGQLEKLLDFMAAHSLEEFEYEHGGLHIRLRKASTGADAAPQAHGAANMPVLTALPATPGLPAESGPHQPALADAAPAEELHVVKSPIVGTFYAAPNPDAAPFVKVGDSVRAGQVVCIVEAMKLMNEIEADASGEIVRALVDNGQPVEYGQPLFALRLEKKK